MDFKKSLQRLRQAAASGQLESVGNNGMTLSVWTSDGGDKGKKKKQPCFDFF